MPLPAERIAAFTEIVGRDAVRSAADLAARDPGVDARNFGADLMIRPGSTAEVARVLAYCHATRIGVVPQGGRTGLSGGAESRPGEVILSLDRLSTIESVDPLSRTALAGAGVTLAALAAACAGHGLSPGIDFGGRDSATVGGMIATNAGGVSAFRHGTMRERVLGLEVVLANGAVLTDLGRVRKRNEGLAVERLLIGAEGTLGVITQAALALVPADGPAATALIAVRDLERAAALCDALQRSVTLVPSAIEFMSGNHAAITSRLLGEHAFEALARAHYVLLVEASAPTASAAEAELVEFLGAAAERGDATDALIAQSEAQRRAMWRVREDWAIYRERPGGLWYDVSVPLTHLPAYLDRLAYSLRAHDPALMLDIVGHLADGNVHITVSAATAITECYEDIASLVTEGLAAVGGSFSAEHGIGLEKIATLKRLCDPVKLALMRRIKHVLDPHGIMNPGKVIPD